MHPDIRDFLSVLEAESAEYLIIGGYAVTFHARPRFTKDIDVWIGSSQENRARVARALNRFGAPRQLAETLLSAGPEDILWFGSAPVRIEIFLTIPGVAFDDAFTRRVETEWNGSRVLVVSRADLIAAKRATGRPQDLLDVEALEQSGSLIDDDLQPDRSKE
jgi:hypothetical protein